VYRPTEEFIKRGELKVEKAIEVHDTFFSEKSTEDISAFYYDEFL
jgi:hypothetical protein